MSGFIHSHFPETDTLHICTEMAPHHNI